MSRIDDSIKELSADGVPFKRLGDVGEFVRGNGLQKSDLTNAGVPAIHYGQVHTTYGTWTKEAVSFVDPQFAKTLRRAAPGDLVIATTSEDDDAVAKAVAWLGAEEAAISGDAYIYRHTLDPKYVSYYLQSDRFQEQKKRSITGTKVRRISGDALAKITIPVPPAEVQREIVRVLDSFGSLQISLERSLQDERDARRRRFQDYRRAILGGTGSESRTVRLGEVADVLVGFPFKSSDFSSDMNDVALVRGDNIGQGFLKAGQFKRWKRNASDRLDAYELQAEDVVLAMDRPWIPAGLKWARINEHLLPALLVQRVARLRANLWVLDQRFLGSVISSPGFTDYILRSQGGNTVPHISSRQIEAFEFSLPTLSEQSKIAHLLDRFDGLYGDLDSALSGEIMARRKQYEYYHDRLFSFEELIA